MELIKNAVSVNKFYNNHNEYKNQSILKAVLLERAVIPAEPLLNEAQAIVLRIVASEGDQ